MTLIVTHEDFFDAIKRIKMQPVLSLDTETTGVDRYGVSRLVGLAVYDGKHSFYFPFRHGQGDNLPEHLLPVLVAATSGSEKVWRMHNAPFDIAIMTRDGWDFPGHGRVGTPTGCSRIEESMVAIHILNENEVSLALKDLGNKYLSTDASLEEDILVTKLVDYLNSIRKTGKKIVASKKLKGEMWRLSASDVGPYAEQDVRLTWDLIEFAIPKLKERGCAGLGLPYDNLYGLWQETNDYQALITRMEMRGILVDTPAAERQIAEAETHMERLHDAMRRMGGPDNPNSHPQVQKWLDVPSSARKALEKLKALKGNDAPPGIDQILEYRGWKRSISNYLQPFIDKSDEHDTIHTNLKITGTISTRLSCSNPPLQALPRKTDIYEVKNVLIARPGYVIMSADYATAEVRVATHFAQEITMLRLLRAGEDIHQYTADAVGVDRQTGKRSNFSLIYRIGPKAFADMLDLPLVEAHRIHGIYHQTYPGFTDLYNRAKDTAEKRGYIRLFTGRRRHYNDRRRAPAHRAMSNLVQGTVAEMIRVAMQRMDRAFREQRVDAHLILQVHDDVKLEVHEGQIEQTARIVHEAMTSFPLISLPMPIDISVGPSLGQTTEINI
jgi:DNA polymerase-1